MKRTLIVSGLLFGFFIVVLIYGYSLPVQHQLSMERHYLQKTPEEIWRVLIDYKNYSQWRENVYEVTEMPQRAGLDAWKEVDADGKSIPYAFALQTPMTQLIIETTDQELPYSGSWIFDLSSDARGTTVRITETGKVENLFMRVLSHFFTGYTSSMNAWLGSLDNKFAFEARRLKSAQIQMAVEQQPVPASSAPPAQQK